MLIRHAVYGFAHRVYRSKGSLFVPRFDAMVPRHKNVLAVLGTREGKFLIPASNIVTDEGDKYYAQNAASESPTNAFGVQVMCSAGTPAKGADYADFTAISGSTKAHTATYPKTNDGDSDNTGADVDIVTYLVSYTKADFNDAAISHGVITNATPVVSPPTPLLTGYAFDDPFAKSANDTLKVFVNHEFLGS
jgi:hypothetical protein